jgi:hypothetical protein
VCEDQVPAATWPGQLCATGYQSSTCGTYMAAASTYGYIGADGMCMYPVGVRRQ